MRPIEFEIPKEVEHRNKVVLYTLINEIDGIACTLKDENTINIHINEDLDPESMSIIALHVGVIIGKVFSLETPDEYLKWKDFNLVN